MLGFGGVVPAADWLAGPNRPGMASGDDTAAMTAAVRAAGEQADLVFVTHPLGGRARHPAAARTTSPGRTR